jgi:hypothetical protein
MHRKGHALVQGSVGGGPDLPGGHHEIVCRPGGQVGDLRLESDHGAEAKAAGLLEQYSCKPPFGLACNSLIPGLKHFGSKEWMKVIGLIRWY